MTLITLFGPMYVSPPCPSSNTFINSATKSNTRFENAKHQMLQGLPEDISANEQEVAMSEFLRNWTLRERQNQEDYAKEWRRRSFGAILLDARVSLLRSKKLMEKRIIMIMEF